jgi:hypothetical protein
MSDLEVISISSGDTSPSPGDTPVVVLSSVLDASFDSPDLCASPACLEHHIDVNELNAWLSERPPTSWLDSCGWWILFFVSTELSRKAAVEPSRGL